MGQTDPGPSHNHCRPPSNFGASSFSDQLAVVNLLRPSAKQIQATALQEWTLDRDISAAEWLTPDVLVVSDSVRPAANGHALSPCLLAVEIRSTQQSGLFNKAQTLFSWGTEHVWIIGPFEQEYFEYHGGEQFTKVTSELRTGTLLLSIPALRLASTL